jgi:RPA family protein
MLHPAKGLFAFEFNESAEYVAGSCISPLGEVYDTVSVAGAVSGVETSRVSGKVTARVSDPTGVFLVDGGKKDSSTGRSLAGAEIPSFLAVTGRAVPDGGMHIIAEAVIPVDRSARDSWACAVLRDTIRRMEASFDNENAKPDLKEMCRYAGLVERVLDAVCESSSPGEDGASGSPDYSEKILEIIDIHSGKKGMPVEDLINTCKSSGLREADIKRTIESLVEDGECYLPAGGYIRRL